MIFQGISEQEEEKGRMGRKKVKKNRTGGGVEGKYWKKRKKCERKTERKWKPGPQATVSLFLREALM